MRSQIIAIALSCFCGSLWAQDEFPVVPYSGVQLKYKITGVTLTESKDEESLARVRFLRGRLTGKTLRVEGVFNSDEPKQSELVVEILMDGQSKSLRIPNETNLKDLLPQQEFQLEIQIPSEIKNASIMILGRTKSILGPREIAIRGEFASVQSPSVEKPSSSVSSGETRAITKKIHGKLVSAPSRGDDWQSVEEEGEIKSGSTLRTGDEDSALLELTDGGELFLDRNSEVMLVDHRIVLQRGSLKYHGETRPEPTTFETPDYFIEFQGARLSIEYNDESTTCAILSGSATLTQLSDITHSVILRDGVRAVATGNKFHLFETIDLRHESQEWASAGLAFSPSPNEDVTEAGKEREGVVIEEEEPGSDSSNPIDSSSPIDAMDNQLVTDPPTSIPIELPADGSIPIIVFDSIGGNNLPRISNEPELVIFADGRGVITDPYGKLPRVTRRLSAENIKEFLGFVINDHHFYEMTTESLQQLEAQISAQAGGSQTTNQPTSVIRIGIRNMTYQLRFSGAEYLAKNYPEVREFRDFRAIEVRLQTFIEQSREWAKRKKNTP